MENLVKNILHYYASHTSYLALQSRRTSTRLSMLPRLAQPMLLPISNVTIVSEPILGAYIKATHVVQQEQLQLAQFGYRNANNWIVGWPIEYFSDVVKYNHSCTWKTPV
jgi:hypothetical protein